VARTSAFSESSAIVRVGQRLRPRLPTSRHRFSGRDRPRTRLSRSLRCGRGNILRGASELEGRDWTRQRRLHGHARYGINALALRDALENQGVPTRVQTAIWMQRSRSRSSVDGPCAIWRKTRRHLRAGTGNPYFTTDTPAVCALWKSAPKPLDGEARDGVTTVILWTMPGPSSSTSSHTCRCSSATSR